MGASLVVPYRNVGVQFCLIVDFDGVVGVFKEPSREAFENRLGLAKSDPRSSCVCRLREPGAELVVLFS